jgi:hypothetical protein
MVAFGIVCLVLAFDSLWVGLGNGLHKNYEAPTPVRHSQTFHAPLLTIAD